MLQHPDDFLAFSEDYEEEQRLKKKPVKSRVKNILAAEIYLLRSLQPWQIAAIERAGQRIWYNAQNDLRNRRVINVK